MRLILDIGDMGFPDMPVSGESGLGITRRLLERIEDDQAPLPPLVRRNHLAGCRGIRRLLREPGRPHRRRSHRRQGLPALLGRLLPLLRRRRSRRRAVARHRRVAHLQRRGARSGREGRRGRRHRGRVVRRPRDRPRLPLHRPLGSHADPALGRRARPRHRGRQRVDLPRPPRTGAARSPALRASSTTSRSPRATSTRSRPGTARCSASASWPRRSSTRRPSRCSRC